MLSRKKNSLFSHSTPTFFTTTSSIRIRNVIDLELGTNTCSLENILTNLGLGTRVC
jgi:hypothetical protein